MPYRSHPISPAFRTFCGSHVTWRRNQVLATAHRALCHRPALTASLCHPGSLGLLTGLLVLLQMARLVHTSRATHIVWFGFLWGVLGFFSHLFLSSLAHFLCPGRHADRAHVSVHFIPTPLRGVLSTSVLPVIQKGETETRQYWLVQRHPAGRWQSPDLNPCRLGC